jgi:hypothetical protein
MGRTAPGEENEKVPGKIFLSGPAVEEWGQVFYTSTSVKGVASRHWTFHA